MFQVFSIIALIFSAIIHEYMHGWMADRLGDPTAKYAGRLTLNPLAHIDPIGSVLLPALLVLSGSPFVFGYAKPVPFNPNNLRDRKYGPAKVALTGPLGNFITAVFFGLLLRFGGIFGIAASPTISGLIAIVIFINLLLMIFNLIPIPPLDGSRILSAFLSYKGQMFLLSIEQYGMILLFLLIFSGLLGFIYPIIQILFGLITGNSLLNLLG